MNRKLPALLLALCLCVSLLTGCKKEDAAEPTPTPDGAAVTLDSAGAWGKHQPDDVVFTVDGSVPVPLTKKAMGAVKKVGLMNIAKDARKGMKAL